MIRSTLLLFALATACAGQNSATNADGDATRVSADSPCDQVYAQCEAALADMGAPDDLSCVDFLQCGYEDYDEDATCETVYDTCVENAQEAGDDPGYCDDAYTECLAYTTGSWDDTGDYADEDAESSSEAQECLDAFTACIAEAGEDVAAFEQCAIEVDVCLEDAGFDASVESEGL